MPPIIKARGYGRSDVPCQSGQALPGLIFSTCNKSSGPFLHRSCFADLDSEILPDNRPDSSPQFDIALQVDGGRKTNACPICLLQLLNHSQLTFLMHKLLLTAGTELAFPDCDLCPECAFQARA